MVHTTRHRQGSNVFEVPNRFAIARTALLSTGTVTLTLHNFRRTVKNPLGSESRPTVPGKRPRGDLRLSGHQVHSETVLPSVRRRGVSSIRIHLNPQCPLANIANRSSDPNPVSTVNPDPERLTGS